MSYWTDEAEVGDVTAQGLALRVAEGDPGMSS